LAQQFPVGTNNASRRGQVPVKCNVLRFQVGLQKNGQLVDEPVKINRLRIRFVRPGEGQKLVDPGGHPIALLDDRTGMFYTVFGAGRVLGEALCPAANQSERIARFVR